MLNESSFIILLMPLLASIYIALFSRKNKKASAFISIGSVFISFIYSVFLLLNYKNIFELNFTWLEVGNLKLSLGILLDPLALIMLLVVSLVSLLVQVYTHAYMHHDAGYSKFYAMLSLFTFSMLALVMSTNLFQLFIFWELVAVSSYLLIGFWHTKEASANASMKAMLVNKLGDCGLLISILLIIFFTRNLWSENSVFLGFRELPEIINKLNLTGNLYILFLISGVLLFLGPMAKSAQFPLHVWLPDAMEGPTPISALIHAATMVAAGVFLLARVFCIYNIIPEALVFIAVTGAFTALYSAFIAMSQKDIKKALAYSTCSQLGLMTMSIGIGAWIPAIFHLMTHAFFKAMLFLCSGSVIHACDGEQDMTRFGALGKKMPITSSCFLIGTLAISAVPMFSGFWSKEQIFKAVWNSGLDANCFHIIFITSILASAMTVFYMFRIYFLTFCGEKYRGKNTLDKIHESPKFITVPLIILSVFSVFSGYVGTHLKIVSGDIFTRFLTNNLNNINSHNQELLTISEFIKLVFTEIYAIVPIIISIILIILSYFIYNKNILSLLRYKLKSSVLYELSFRKFYLDEIYIFFVNKIFMPIIKIIYIIFDRFFSDSLFTGGLAKIGLFKAKNASRIFHSGKLQVSLAILVIILSLFILVFSIGPAKVQLDLLARFN